MYDFRVIFRKTAIASAVIILLVGCGNGASSSPNVVDKGVSSLARTSSPVVGATSEVGGIQASTEAPGAPSKTSPANSTVQGSGGSVSVTCPELAQVVNASGRDLVGRQSYLANFPDGSALSSPSPIRLKPGTEARCFYVGKNPELGITLAVDNLTATQAIAAEPTKIPSPSPTTLKSTYGSVESQLFEDYFVTTVRANGQPLATCGIESKLNVSGGAKRVLLMSIQKGETCKSFLSSVKLIKIEVH